MIDKIPNNLIKIINDGEGSVVEFKKSEKKLDNKVRNLITSLSRDNVIKNIGSDWKPIWKNK